MSDSWLEIPANPSSAKNDGGPAFGEFKQCGDNSIKNGGLTVRDYFAARAMQGFMSRTLVAGFDDEVICQRSFEIADQMLIARENQE